MRVLLTTDTVGGVWTFTRELTEGLLEQGHSVALASFGRTPSPEQSKWADEVYSRHREDFIFSAFDIPLEWMSGNERALLEGEAVLSDLIDLFSPDLLHANQFCFGALDGSLPRLITAHSDVLSWAAACRPQGLDSSSWLHQYRHIVQRGLDGADAVIAPTHAMLHALGENFRLPEAQHVILNGRTLPSSTEPPPPRMLQAVTAGRLWDEAKNVALLAGIDAPVPLIVAGEQCFSPQQTTVDAAPLHFTGTLPERDLLRLFQASAIYIVPSIYEPFGLAPLEAALSGCAILANELPSLREVWADAATYFHDSSSLERQLRRLTQNSDLLATAQQRAHARALTLSRDAMVARYTKLYRELMQSSEQPGTPGLSRRGSASVSPDLRLTYLTHSLRSDWNNGNAHFLRGLLASMHRLGHTLEVLEPEHEWSINNLRDEPEGQRSLDDFARLYPDLPIRTYPADLTDRDAWRELLRSSEIVILHEWNPPALAQLLLELRDELGFRLLFHDTHHRASSSPEQIAAFGLASFDGVLVFGEVLRSIYRDRFGIHRVWVLHEAADTTIFRPLATTEIDQDAVWIGNWGDNERSAEIQEFFLEPAAALHTRPFTIYGVRYPPDGLAALNAANVRYSGYLPNLDAPRIYSRSRLTVHIPRRQYSTVMVGIPTIRIFEALACGIPLLSAPWQDTEFLFRPGDIRFVKNGTAMRDAMVDLLNNPAKAAEYAARGRETVLARHTCDHRARELTAICQELLA